jgi:hypothetical protein
MTDIMDSPVYLHVIAVVVLLVLIFYHIYKLNFTDKFVDIQNSYRLTTPFFHFINASVAYTGVIISAYRHDLSWTVILMITATLFVMISEIKRYKRLRVILSHQDELQKSFKIFATKIAIYQIVLLLFVYVVAVIF